MPQTLSALGLDRSISGRIWKHRTAAGGQDSALQDDIVAQLLLSRGVERADLARHRTPTLRSFLPDPSVFADMDRAAQRIAESVIAGEQVTVYGDYDVDGATSAALLIRLYRTLGLEAGHYIPDRLLEGYGPSGEALVALGQQGSTLVVTVDCGAMAFDALAAADQAGIDVIVVDHHKCAPELPRTLALVNPNRLDESETAAEHGHLAAVGVAFLLAVAVVRVLRERGYFKDRAEPDLMSLLDLVALGTVADMAAIKGLNRAFVAQGLKVMARRGNTGLAALIDASRLKRAPAASDCGFALGPRINAAGRVGDSSLGVRLLTTEDAPEAEDIASRLSDLNDERRAIEAAVQEAAEQQLAAQHNRSVVITAGKGWHPGVIGIVAGRLKEKTGKPTLVIALDEESGQGKGSGRSIAGVDLGAAIIGAREAGLLVAGGGHAMAGGLSLEPEQLPALRTWMTEHMTAFSAERDAARELAIDALLAPSQVTTDTYDLVQTLGPFGQGAPEPVFLIRDVRVTHSRVLGEKHLKLSVESAQGRFDALVWRCVDTPLGDALQRGGQFHLAGRLKDNVWRDRRTAQIDLIDAAVVAQA